MTAMTAMTGFPSFTPYTRIEARSRNRPLRRHSRHAWQAVGTYCRLTSVSKLLGPGQQLPARLPATTPQAVESVSAGDVSGASKGAA